jgi:two-component system response regulator QseB
MKILLIEDDLDLGNGVRIALADQGMDVVWVRHMAAADEHLATGGCDLVLLDLGLPDGDGLHLLAKLRRNRSFGKIKNAIELVVVRSGITLRRAARYRVQDWAV